MVIRRIEESEKGLVIKWLDAIDWKGMSIESFPTNTFIVFDESEVAVACSWYYYDESCKMVLMGHTVADPLYTESKGLLISNLLDHVIKDMSKKGAAACYYSTVTEAAPFLKKYMEPRGFRFKQGLSGVLPLSKKTNDDYIL